jgi:DNA recombination protein RmuC
MAEHAEDLGKYLKKAVEHYNSMIGSIETRVLVTTRKFKALGELSTEDCPKLPQSQ